MADDDMQLALYCCYELHYRGFAGVDDRWEWEPSLIRFRAVLEEAFDSHLRRLLADQPVVPAEEVPDALWAMTAQGGGRSLSRWLVEHGTLGHAREFAMHRSAYQLKEADPHTWGIPRLTGRAKAAMVTIQTDEYGGGIAARMHSSLFAEAMVALDLDPTYGAYLDLLPGSTLATCNLISMFGLHRRLRGALVGHLALFEMTSVGPMSRYARWLRTLGVSPEGRVFYDVHVEADEVHQHIAADDLVGGLLAAEPDLGQAVLFGARAVSLVESCFSSHLLDRWIDRHSSLTLPSDGLTTALAAGVGRA
ncbi:MAG: iron-containing redox enzyme family protein, partial [Actinomycetota bacterium]|nr:iron-containing redox enzyme family protein [Actinomycetota bacterium]